MKRTLVLAAVLLAALSVLVAWKVRTQGPRRAAEATAASAQGTDPVLGVEALMHAVDRYRGTVRVEGAVSAASAETQTLALIDTKELEKCGVTTCAPLSLPVRWSGNLPEIGQLVRVEGSVSEADGKLVFVAQTLQPMQRTGSP